ncbi:hypothetical protein [Pontibacter flavimaris]|uniref:Uncharacterized protein n=1 Tax=Pontibacter flavimaris TaxID=1797110 RepID=A0A1Q5P8Z2_9BACT|nr:hypothetical protein [Pontibacter flavimaris]OKL38697.1 hypothetical protein A3841_06035 [Pontibacter flavimaris]
MDRRERDRYENNNYGPDYSGYEGYGNDSHYHSARNLTDEFERHYRGDDYGRTSPTRSYHEGDMGDAYERRRRDDDSFRGNSGYQRTDWSQNRSYPQSMSRDRDRFSNYQDDYRSYEDRNSGSRDNDRNLRQGYGISSYEGTSDRYNTLGSSRSRGGSGDDQSYYSGRGDRYSSARFGGGMGDSSIHSDRGIPNYNTRSFSDNYGTGMGSSYGGSNYGGGTGYSGGHRGGSFGQGTYGSSSGNYGGSSSMGGGSYGGRSNSGRGETSHNSDRGTRELGGF